MKKLLLILGLLTLSVPAWGLTGTASATIKVYKAYVSASGNCSNPITILDTPSGTSVDMAAAPTIGNGSIADGTYKCVIFKMSDSVSFTPSANDGSFCVAGTSYTMDVCKDNGSGAPTVTNPETGATASCTAGEDTIWIYVSRFSTVTAGSQTSNPHAPPTADGDATNGFKLNNDIVITGDTTGTFTFGTNNKVSGSGTDGPANECNMEPPDFGFAINS